MSDDNNKETITGELTNIIYRNDNGFMIGTFLTENEAWGKEVKVKGTMINPQVGMEYELTGSWDNHPRFGNQFAFDRFKSLEPADVDGIYKYIVRTCKFVGPSIGQQIIEMYGENALRVMKEDPGLIALNITGITLDRAQEIQKTLIENEDMEATMCELERILDVPGMHKSLIGKLIDKYGPNAPAIIQENPYMLTEFRGIGFILADLVALHIGFPRDAIERQTAAIIYCINENMQGAGHIWISHNILTERIGELIQVKADEGLQQLLDQQCLIETDGDYALKMPAENERLISQKITQIERRTA